MGEGLEGRTKTITDEKFKALNKALKIDKKKPQGKLMNGPEGFCAWLLFSNAEATMPELVAGTRDRWSHASLVATC